MLKWRLNISLLAKTTVNCLCSSFTNVETLLSDVHNAHLNNLKMWFVVRHQDLRFFYSNRTAFSHSVTRVRTRFLSPQGTVYSTVHWELRGHNETISRTQHTWSRSALHKLTEKMHLNTGKPQFQRTEKEDKPRAALNIQTKTMNYNSQNLIQFKFKCGPHSPVWIRRCAKLIHFKVKSALNCPGLAANIQNRLNCLALDFVLNQPNGILPACKLSRNLVHFPFRNMQSTV